MPGSQSGDACRHDRWPVTASGTERCGKRRGHAVPKPAGSARRAVSSVEACGHCSGKQRLLQKTKLAESKTPSRELTHEIFYGKNINKNNEKKQVKTTSYCGHPSGTWAAGLEGEIAASARRPVHSRERGHGETRGRGQRGGRQAQVTAEEGPGGPQKDRRVRRRLRPRGGRHPAAS